MVKITRDYLLRNRDNLKLVLRQRKESDDEFLKRITHLKLQGRFIDSFDTLKECSNVTCLYLQNNCLPHINNLECFSKLTHLYLQRNKISKIQNLDELVNLRKLYLGYNEIAVVEGLERLKALKELHLEYQNLPLGETIYFDPRSVASLAGCVEVINISGNGLLTLTPLKNVTNLTELLATDNKLQDIQEVAEVLSTWPNLLAIKLSGNPLTARRDFRDILVLSGRRLKQVDGTEISPEMRNFLEGWTKAKRTKEAVGKGGKDSGQKPTEKAVGPNVHFVNTIRGSGDATRPVTFQPWKLRKSMPTSRPSRHQDQN